MRIPKAVVIFLGLLGAAVHVEAQHPAIFYSTYVGQEGARESITDIKVDSAGDAYVTYDVRDETGPGHDFVVSKISPAGRKGYTTVLGHFYSEEGATALALDASGNAYITGWAQSYPSGHPRFPTLNALQFRPAGGVDAVIVKLNPQGEVVFSTYLGGSGNDYGRDITVDTAGNIYVTGTTSSDDFPTRNPYQSQRVRGGDAGADIFVTKINAAGSAILYSTYLGGNDDDSVSSIAVDSGGSIYLAGSTKSSSFADTNLPGLRWSGYAVKFNSTGSNLIYSFAWSDVRQDHIVVDAALDAADNLYVAEHDAVRKLNSTGTAVVYSKTIPADISAVAVDGEGHAYATGTISSDLYVLEISPSGGEFINTTSLNGTLRTANDPANGVGSSVGKAIAVTAAGSVYVGGYSESLNFPTTNGSTRSRWTKANTQDAIFFVIQP